MNFDNRVRLRGVLPHTASCVAIDERGGLVVELYDFSPEAHTCLGNDVAFLMHLGTAEKAHVLRRLIEGRQPADAADRDALVLHLIAERFADYYDVKRWLEAEGIPYRDEFVPWA